MHFPTRKQAIEYMKAEKRIIPSLSLRVVKSSYMDMSTYRVVGCWCVVKG